MKQVLSLIIVLSLLGCATPSQRFHEKTIELGFNSQWLKTAQFQHQLYLNNKQNTSSTLHVYLDGDGTPWQSKRWIAEDPTARNPLILRLMQQDDAPSILLGRPCYYGLNQTTACKNKYWTSHRYSSEVVSSMTIALNNWLKKTAYSKVVLIGYSGGGSLAILMANKIINIKKVVTVAANLDVKSWSEFHGYSTLKNSLNPINQDVINSYITQIHFAGKDDQIVPSFVINKYAQTQKGAVYYELEGHDHSCCWEDEWLSILSIVQ